MAQWFPTELRVPQVPSCGTRFHQALHRTLSMPTFPSSGRRRGLSGFLQQVLSASWIVWGTIQWSQWRLFMFVYVCFMLYFFWTSQDYFRSGMEHGGLQHSKSCELDIYIYIDTWIIHVWSLVTSLCLIHMFLLQGLCRYIPLHTKSTKQVEVVIYLLPTGICWGSMILTISSWGGNRIAVPTDGQHPSPQDFTRDVVDAYESIVIRDDLGKSRCLVWLLNFVY